MAEKSPPGLHGRADELVALRRCLDAAGSGRAQTAFVEGEAGIGKTRLVEEVVREAARRGLRVMAAAAEELERNRPFGPLRDALRCHPDSPDARRAELGRMLAGEDGAAGTPAFPFRLVDAFVGLVEIEALQGPLLLVLEDLHWADGDTLLTVHAIRRRLAIVPVVLLATLRPAGRPELDRLVESCEVAGGTRLRLGPLEPGAVASIVAEAVGAEPGPGLLTQAAGAGGNPLYVTELIAALAGEGAIERDGDRAEVRGAGVPPTLRPTILRRIAFLPEETRAVLRIASVLGAAFSVADLAAAMGRSAVDLVAPLEEARRAGLLVEDGERMRFRHDLLREAIYMDLPAGVRAALHTEAGKSLAARGADALRVAEQFALGATGVDPQAADWLLRGARAVAPRAPAAAADLMRRALTLMGPDDARNHEIRAQLADLCVLTGSAPEAEALAREILRGPRAASLEAPLRLTLVRALFTQGRWEELVREAQAGAASAAVPDDARARLLAESCLAQLWCLNPEAGQADGEEAVRLGRSTDDALATSLALSHLSALAGLRGNLLESVELAQAGLAAATTDEARRRHPHVALGITLMDVGRMAEALQTLREGMRLGELLGTAWDLPIYHTLLGFHGLHAGAWDDAIAETKAGLALGEEIGSHPVALAAHAILATIAVHRDDLDTARAAVEATARILERSGPQWSLWLALRARALLEEAEGDGAAIRTLAAAWEQFAAGGAVHSQLHVGADLVRMAVGADERPLALRVTERLEAIAARAEVPYARGTALLARGLCDGDATRLGSAMAAFRESGRVRDAAVAAEAAALAGRDEHDRALLGTAIEAYETLGASRDLARALAAARAVGLKRGRRGARKRPESGWESLTPSELEVARLAVEGLTNPQIGERLFISRRTVQTHLSHVFAKLGLASRVELAAHAARRGGG